MTNKWTRGPAVLRLVLTAVICLGLALQAKAAQVGSSWETLGELPDILEAMRSELRNWLHGSTDSHTNLR